jgi:hypothetical protein
MSYLATRRAIVVSLTTSYIARERDLPIDVAVAVDA